MVEHQPLLNFLALKSSRMASVSWSPHLGSFHICRHVCGCSCDTSCDSFSTSQLSHKPAFTQTRFSTHHLLHQPALEISPVNQTSFYPHQLLRKPTFRPTSFYTNIRTPSQTTFCTNHVLHQPTLTNQLLHSAFTASTCAMPQTLLGCREPDFWWPLQYFVAFHYVEMVTLW